MNPGNRKPAFFTTNRHNFKYTPKIDLYGVQLKKKSNPVYLGIKLNTEQRYRSHISDMEAKGRKKLNQVMRSIAGMEWGA